MTKATDQSHPGLSQGLRNCTGTLPKPSNETTTARNREYVGRFTSILPGEQIETMTIKHCLPPVLQKRLQGSQAERPLGAVGSTRYRVYTSDLATTSSTWGLLCGRARTGKVHLGVGFALRCVQRFSILDVAIRRWPGQANRHTSGPAAPVLSYWKRIPATFLRPRRIETELSRDVLNPARVPL